MSKEKAYKDTRMPKYNYPPGMRSGNPPAQESQESQSNELPTKTIKITPPEGDV